MGLGKNEQVGKYFLVIVATSVLKVKDYTAKNSAKWYKTTQKQ